MRHSSVWGDNGVHPYAETHREKHKRAHKRWSKDPRHWLDKSASVCTFCLIFPTTGWKWPVWLTMNINVTHVRLRQFGLIWCVTSLAVKRLQRTKGGKRWITVDTGCRGTSWLTWKWNEYATLIDITEIRGPWWHFWLPPAGKISLLGPHAQSLSSKKNKSGPNVWLCKSPN